jgi:hypothetical protein
MITTRSTTKGRHTCGGPAFGRKTPGCPRCDELLAGAAPIRQPWRETRKCRCGAPAQRGYMVPICRRCEIAAHDCQASHCGPVCTAFDW